MQRMRMATKTEGIWEKVFGFSTAGGDPLYRCPNCGSEHVYGIEHPKKHNFCLECGQHNIYPCEADDNGHDR